ncbi:hypothetical protein B7P34_14690 [Streptosporangium nondiastaticum]|uniref:Uncharacterized protein n=1 Tax=Streptosporangium nondiastaticum TaxID=35764 RepID=A0A9X7JQH9_9ACTN|nr:hypothetical protein [Streptosporangium nondiastaticum]PSJ28023.1 hypothetical protein B7P34_14690 [Streptosporangium nondiastaticum]
MPNPVKDVTFSEYEPESLAELRGLCARMSPHWTGSPGQGRPAVAVPPSLIRGVSVPAGSARLIDGMSEYGD